MKKEGEQTKLERFEQVYQLHAKNVYRVCLYYVRDKNKAQEIVEQVFVDFYKHFEEVTPNYAFGYMVHQAKRLIQEDEMTELVVQQQEVTA